MHHHLPDDEPAITLIGPDATDFWAAAGEPAASRYALVIGDPARPDTATLISGTRLDVAGYLDPLHGPLTTAVAQLGHQVVQGLTPGERDLLYPPAGSTRRPQPPDDDVERITVPHTGLRVPARDKSTYVGAYRQVRGREGAAFEAVLYRGGRRVGQIFNGGTGGSSLYRPDPHSGFGQRQLGDFAASCRTGSGHQPSTDDVLEALIDEHNTARHVAKTSRDGRVAVRLVMESGGLWWTRAEGSTGPVTSIAGRIAVAADLHAAAPPADDERYQFWDGQAWEDLEDQPAVTH